jgi:hypothetical protein
MTIHKLVFKHSNGEAVDYIGHYEGEIFYNDADKIIRISDGVTPGGIVIGYGSGTDIPQIIVDDDSHDLLLSDHGQHIYLINQSEVRIDNGINDVLPIGYTVVLITDDTEGWVYNNDTGDIDVYGAGMDATAEYWAIPAHSMGTLIKTGDSRWMFSGAGLYDDS